MAQMSPVPPYPVGLASRHSILQVMCCTKMLMLQTWNGQAWHIAWIWPQLLKMRPLLVRGYTHVVRNYLTAGKMARYFALLYMHTYISYAPLMEFISASGVVHTPLSCSAYAPHM